MRCFILTFVAVILRLSCIHAYSNPTSLTSSLRTSVLIDYSNTLSSPNVVSPYFFVDYMRIEREFATSDQPSPDAKLNADGTKLTFCGLYPERKHYGSVVYANIMTLSGGSLVPGAHSAIAMNGDYKYRSNHIAEWALFGLRTGKSPSRTNTPLLKYSIPYATNTAVMFGETSTDNVSNAVAWYSWPNTIWGADSYNPNGGFGSTILEAIEWLGIDLYMYYTTHDSFFMRSAYVSTESLGFSSRPVGIAPNQRIEVNLDVGLFDLGTITLYTPGRNITHFHTRMIAANSNDRDYIFYFATYYIEHSNLMVCRNSSGEVTYNYSGTNTFAPTNYATRLCIDSSGKVYAANLGSGQFAIWKYESSGVFNEKITGATTADTTKNIDLCVLQNDSTAIPCLLIDYISGSKRVIGIKPILGNTTSRPEYIFCDYDGDDPNNAKIVHDNEFMIVANRKSSNGLDLYVTRYKIIGSGSSSTVRVFTKKSYTSLVSDCNRIMTMELKNNNLWITYMTPNNNHYKCIYIDVKKLYE